MGWWERSCPVWVPLPVGPVGQKQEHSALRCPTPTILAAGGPFGALLPPQPLPAPHALRGEPHWDGRTPWLLLTISFLFPLRLRFNNPFLPRSFLLPPCSSVSGCSRGQRSVRPHLPHPPPPMGRPGSAAPGVGRFVGRSSIPPSRCCWGPSGSQWWPWFGARAALWTGAVPVLGCFWGRVPSRLRASQTVPGEDAAWLSSSPADTGEIPIGCTPPSPSLPPPSWVLHPLCGRRWRRGWLQHPQGGGAAVSHPQWGPATNGNPESGLRAHVSPSLPASPTLSPALSTWHTWARGGWRRSPPLWGAKGRVGRQVPRSLPPSWASWCGSHAHLRGPAPTSGSWQPGASRCAGNAAAELQ